MNGGPQKGGRDQQYARFCPQKHRVCPVISINTKFVKGPILTTMHPFLSAFVPGFVQTERLLILVEAFPELPSRT